jgi:3-oxoacyl-[acyl-carrier protein] reductase
VVATSLCDVPKVDDINKAATDVMRALGKVDILINNVGISRAMNLDKVTDEIWPDDLDLKQFAAIRLPRLAWDDQGATRSRRTPR